MSTHFRRLRSVTALLMAAFFLFASSVPALAASDGDTSRSVPWDEMEYEHYDAADFNAKVEEMSAAAEDGDADKVISLYDELYDEYVLAYTYNTLAIIYNSQDVNDEYWADELVYSSTLNTEMSDTLLIACHDALEGPCADAFAAHVGENAAQEFRDYTPLTTRDLELTERESELITEYNALMDKQNDIPFVYEGEEWTIDRLMSEDGMSLSDDVIDEIIAGIYDELSRQAGNIYLEMVSLRTEFARRNGYDDYNHYIYEQRYDRDYTPAQAQELFDEVKKISRRMHDSDVLNLIGEVAPTYDTQEDLLAVVREYAGKVDPIFDESWQFMTDNGLCDFSVGSGRSVSSFTIGLPAYDSAFIYSDEMGSYFALTTAFHEFGHFTASRLVPPENLLTSRTILDLAEIHSTGMELLMTPFYDEIFDQGADIARYVCLFNILSNVTDQANYAEFEAVVYSDPEAYSTPEALNTLYNDISVEYGFVDKGSDYSWIFVPHFFQDPDYMVSYATSALASIQIWAASQEDWQTGADIYMDIVRQGQYDLSYFDVLENAGLKSFDTAGVATEVCEQVLDELNALETGILDQQAASDAPAEAEQTVPAEDESATEESASEEDVPEEVSPVDIEDAEDSENASEPVGEESRDVLDVQTQSLPGAEDTGADEIQEEKPDVLG